MALTRSGAALTARPFREAARVYERFDLLLVGGTLCLLGFGAAMVAVASGSRRPALTSAVQHQLLFDVIGVAVAAIFVFVDYSHLESIGAVVYGGALVLLLLVLSPLGSTVNGARSWFSLGSFELQPAEFVKLGMILVLAVIAGRSTTSSGLMDQRVLVVCLAVLAVPAGLIMLQPDLGEVLVITAITAAVIVVAGASARHLAVLALIGAIGTIAVFHFGFIKHYQLDRLTYFVNPVTSSGGAGYNAHQAEVAIGSGGLTGSGLFHGTQTQLHFVPEQQTDFIFSVVGEQLGFLGTVTMLALDALISWRLWRAAVLARDTTGTLICTGTLAMFLFHVFENAGMNMGIMPITGIPLPLVSYGGSATIVMLAAIGMSLGVYGHRYR